MATEDIQSSQQPKRSFVEQLTGHTNLGRFFGRTPTLEQIKKDNKFIKQEFMDTNNTKDGDYRIRMDMPYYAIRNDDTTNHVLDLGKPIQATKLEKINYSDDGYKDIVGFLPFENHDIKLSEANNGSYTFYRYDKYNLGAGSRYRRRTNVNRKQNRKTKNRKTKIVRRK